jgi:hypothetical protein
VDLWDAKQRLSRSEYSDYLRLELVATAKSVLSGEMGIIAGSRLLWRLGDELNNQHDPDFKIFIAADTETDHLPVDKERENWSEEALKRKDVEIAEYEAHYRQKVMDGCRRILERYSYATDAQSQS